MDFYAAVALIKTLFASFGVKASLAILAVGGFFYLLVLIARYVAGLFEKILTARDTERAAYSQRQDQMMAQLLERMAASDRRRAVVEAAATRSLANMTAAQERTANELGRMRDEHGSKLSGIQSDIKIIKDRGEGRHSA